MWKIIKLGVVYAAAMFVASAAGKHFTDAAVDAYLQRKAQKEEATND